MRRLLPPFIGCRNQRQKQELQDATVHAPATALLRDFVAAAGLVNDGLMHDCILVLLFLIFIAPLPMCNQTSKVATNLSSRQYLILPFWKA